MLNETQIWDIDNVSLQDNFNLHKDKFFNELLKNSPDFIKKIIYEKYKYLYERKKYNPLFDYLILNTVKDVKEQEKLLKLLKEFADIVYLDTNLKSLKVFINFLNYFSQQEIIKFLKKSIEDDLLTTYVTRVNLFYKNFEIINDNISETINFNYRKFKKI